MRMTDIKNKIHELIESAYRMGYEDGKNLEYDLGLNDAWECARKLMLGENDGGISIEESRKIFGVGYYSALSNYSASEAIAKLKEYEEKQKPVEDAEIKVGDEVIYCGGGAHDGSVGVVLGAENSWREVRFKSCWNCVGVWKDSLTKTGRHFDSIEKVFEELGNEKY